MLGALISAGSSILKGVLGKKSAKKQRDIEYERQKEFAQQGIRWKVADAKSAGIHPLYALGAGTTSYAPQYVGGSDSGIAAAGQEIGRAINTHESVGGRNKAFVEATQQLSLQRMELENQLLSSKIATANQTMHPPAPAGENFVVDGQPQSGLIKNVPMMRERGLPGREFQEPAPITDKGFIKTKHGYANVQSHDAKQRLEEDILGSVYWNIRNRLLPTLGYYNPPYKAPPMRKWRYNPLTDTYSFKKNRYRRRS